MCKKKRRGRGGGGQKQVANLYASSLPDCPRSAIDQERGNNDEATAKDVATN